MKEKVCCLSGNVLKLFAAVCMVIDHVGLMFFPNLVIFRVIGRLAFPIFAFMISEGARYTKNKIRYFIFMFSIAAVCQIVYYFFDNGSLYMCILVTFSLSILLIYALNYMKRAVFSQNINTTERVFSLLLFLFSVTAVYILTLFIEIDYGFNGILIPLFASLLDFRGIEAPECVKKLDCLPVRVASLGFGVLMFSVIKGGIQYFSLLALIPLLLYSGKRGKYKMKYFFYIFYPLHLVLLEAVYIIIYFL